MVVGTSVINFDGGKEMFTTNLEEGMRDQGKFLEKICVFGFSNDINDSVKDIKRENGGHCGIERRTSSLKDLIFEHKLRLDFAGQLFRANFKKSETEFRNGLRQEIPIRLLVL